MTGDRCYLNRRDRSWRCPAPSGAADFHRGLPDYAPTPVIELSDLATALGVGRLVAKDESSRLGLPAFKGLGASWAIRRVLDGYPPDADLTLVTATDGNHGRAVARFARLAGRPAAVFLPRAVHPAAVAAIETEAAQVTIVPGSYDDAVAAARDHAAAAPGRALVQDTAWEGYEEVPGWIVDGYDTLLVELDRQLEAAPDLVVVPTGVGSLLQGVLAHYRSADDPAGTAVVAVEPTVAACLPPSLAADRIVTVPTGVSCMAGLNCGTPSSLAWPYIRGGLDAAVAVTDEEAVSAARILARYGVDAGPCGAASLAALRHLVDTGRRDPLGLGPDSTVALLVTEGTRSNPLPE